MLSHTFRRIVAGENKGNWRAGPAAVHAFRAAPRLHRRQATFTAQAWPAPTHCLTVNRATRQPPCRGQLTLLSLRIMTSSKSHPSRSGIASSWAKS